MTLLKQIEQVRQSVDTWESMCVSQASTLVSNFRKERIGLQREWFNQMARRGSTRGSHSIGTWCPLNLFSRLHNGSLQIYWQLVYRDRATRSVGYKHLAKRKADDVEATGTQALAEQVMARFDLRTAGLSGI